MRRPKLTQYLTGQDSRVANTFLSPVSHPKLPFKAAPGQLSAAEINVKRYFNGAVRSQKFFIFGKPVAHSRSPGLHNTLFKENGLPHEYGRIETDDVAELKETLFADGFGGASITIPLKLDIMKYLDEVSEEADIIGAVNTIVVDRSRSGIDHYGHRLIGRNTDWLGMRKVLENAGARVSPDTSALVIGGGGTARAAIFTLHKIGYSPIYVLGRSASRLRALVQSFDQEYNLYILTTLEAASHMSPPAVAVGTIPADKPVDPDMEKVLNKILTGQSGNAKSTKRVLLEMAYKPAVTPLMELAQSADWVTVPGLEVLAAQGLYQFEAWTGIKPLFTRARDIVLGG